jgi:xylulokinase
MPLLLGIDVGTSATKALLIDTSGRVVAEGSADHEVSQPHPGWSEQDPEWWWQAVRKAVAATVYASKRPAAEVAAIGLSGQMHGSVLLNRATVASEGTAPGALRPALLWNDQRTSAQCNQIEEAAGGRRRLVELVGNAALTGFTLPKLLWIRELEPHIFDRASVLLLPKDYIRFRLTGRCAIDVGDASGTLLMDINQRTWSESMLAATGLDASLLPTICESAEVAGRLTNWAASQIGLPPGIPVAGGSGDNMAGAVGAGIVRPGMVVATIGTSGVIYAHAERPFRDIGGQQEGRIHTMCSGTGSGPADPGQWCLTGCMLSAGGSLRWCRDTLFPGTSYDTLMNEAAIAPPSCEGLVFLPYLTGERCPYPDPQARGGWIGLTSRHGRGHLIRSVIEGVTFGLGQILDLMRGVGVRIDRVRLGGGGARSPLWRQMQADIFGCPVELPNTEEGPAFGAALMAGVGAGIWPSVAAACDATVQVTQTIEPSPDAPRYEPARRVYADLYPALKPQFAALSAAAG